MLKMIKNSDIRRPEEIEEKYPGCMYILTDFTDVNDMKGHLYAISYDKDSFQELCKLTDELSNSGKTCIIMGEYEEGGVLLGVQREDKR